VQRTLACTARKADSRLREGRQQSVDMWAVIGSLHLSSIVISNGLFLTDRSTIIC
jgi:hypothetical protein